MRDLESDIRGTAIPTGSAPPARESLALWHALWGSIWVLASSRSLHLSVVAHM